MAHASTARRTKALVSMLLDDDDEEEEEVSLDVGPSDPSFWMRLTVSRSESVFGLVCLVSSVENCRYVYFGMAPETLPCTAQQLGACSASECLGPELIWTRLLESRNTFDIMV